MLFYELKKKIHNKIIPPTHTPLSHSIGSTPLSGVRLCLLRVSRSVWMSVLSEANPRVYSVDTYYFSVHCFQLVKHLRSWGSEWSEEDEIFFLLLPQSMGFSSCSAQLNALIQKAERRENPAPAGRLRNPRSFSGRFMFLHVFSEMMPSEMKSLVEDENAGTWGKTTGPEFLVQTSVQPFENSLLAWFRMVRMEGDFIYFFKMTQIYSTWSNTLLFL